MLDKLTPRARRVAHLAEQHALRLNSDCIEAEHLLLGIIDEGRGIPARIFSQRGIPLKDIIGEIEKWTPKNTARTASTPPVFSKTAEQVIDLANKAALESGQTLIGTEHLLKGILEEPKSVGSLVLSRFGFKVEDIPQDIAVAKLPEPKPVPPLPPPVIPQPIVAEPALPSAPVVPPPPVPVAAAPEPLIVIPEIPKVSVPEGFDPIEWFTSVLATCSVAEEIARMTKEKLLPAMEAMKKFTKK